MMHLTTTPLQNIGKENKYHNLGHRYKNMIKISIVIYFSDILLYSESKLNKMLFY